MKPLLALLLILTLASCAHVPPAPLPLVPYPQSLVRGEGALVLGQRLDLRVQGHAPDAERALHALLTRLHIQVDPGARVHLTLHLDKFPDIGAEGYRLTVAENITLEANTDIGLLHAVQTLRQLLPARPAAARSLPHLRIVDRPAYRWRGSSLDVARSFLPVRYLKKHIDRMAFFKLNRLHLHLTDDQGWRIQINAYPELTKVGGASAVKGGRAGFYTQQELRELVAYAQARGIVIVPEIDLPGHTQAAIASMHELACDDVTNLAPYAGLDVGFSKLCMNKPAVIYPFVRQVLKEVVAIFPSRYIHIGGDEIKDPGYAGFVTRASRIVDELGRTAIIWEEGSKGDTRPQVPLQLWNDGYPIQAAVKQGHPLILSPCSYFYLDHGNYAGQPDTYSWCRKQGVPLARVYSFRPEAFPAALGVEGALWSELVHTQAAADNRLWPRMAAVAELGWTPAKRRDYASFRQRLGALRAHLDAMGIHYYPEPDLGWSRAKP